MREKSVSSKKVTKSSAPTCQVEGAETPVPAVPGLGPPLVGAVDEHPAYARSQTRGMEEN